MGVIECTSFFKKTAQYTHNLLSNNMNKENLNFANNDFALKTVKPYPQKNYSW